MTGTCNNAYLNGLCHSKFLVQFKCVFVEMFANKERAKLIPEEIDKSVITQFANVCKSEGVKELFESATE